MTWVMISRGGGVLDYIDEASGALIGRFHDSDPVCWLEVIGEAIEAARTIQEARTLLEASAILWQTRG